MTDTEIPTDVDRPSVRQIIRETIQTADGDAIDRADLAYVVGTRAGVDEAHVQTEVDRLEAEGFVYLVDGTVKLA